MNPRKLVGYLGLVLLVLGGFMATSLPWAFVDAEHTGRLVPWAVAVAITLLAGAVGLFVGRGRGGGGSEGSQKDGPFETEITRREALVIVTLAWVLCSVFSALPFVLDGMTSGVVDALFEATAGFTTTGSTILTDIESNSLASLWWRSMLQWIGGMGIIVLFVAILPHVGSGGRRLFESEMPGPTKEQLRPRIRETGLALWRIYAGLTLGLFVLLYLLGLSGFDAACHALTTMASGGFSTKGASIAAFDSALVDVTITLFMLLAGTNFALYYALQRGAGLTAFRDREFGVYIGVFAVATAIVTASILSLHDGNVLLALRYGSFQVAAMLSSTGFSTDNFDVYPGLARVLLVGLMFMGGMGGSTAGGFKISRVVIALAAAVQEMRHAVHPRAIFSTRIGSRVIQPPVVASVLAMFVIAVVAMACSTLVLCGLGLGFQEGFSASLTCLFNMGPGLGELGPDSSFASVPDVGKLLLCFLMILGRLEFYTVLALFLPGFWRSR